MSKLPYTCNCGSCAYCDMNEMDRLRARIQELEAERDEARQMLGERMAVVLDERDQARAEVERLKGWKQIDRKDLPMNYEKLKHSQPFMEELVSLQREEIDRLRAALESIRDGDASTWPDCSARKRADAALSSRPAPVESEAERVMREALNFIVNNASSWGLEAEDYVERARAALAAAKKGRE